ncbi:MAG TPA: HEAT repeat domain-containing protein, partial [Gemmataceae bacterium]|nr:HEAT repeat domain-containing protein [Gemmataceae bacterium]
VISLWMLQKEAKPAVKALAKLLDDPNDHLRRTVASALAALGHEAEEAVPALEAALTHEDEVLRVRAAGALGEIGDRAKAAAKALNKAMEPSNKMPLRVQAAQALWAIQGQTQDVVRVLSEGVKDKDLERDSRLSAAVTLGKIAEKNTAADLLAAHAVPVLREGLADADDSVRAIAAETLGGLGALARPALHGLIQLLENREAEIRAVAAEALGKIAEAEAKGTKGIRARIAYPTLLFLSKTEPNPVTRQVVSQALTKVGRPGTGDVDTLLDVVEGKDVDKDSGLSFRTVAAQALGMTGLAGKEVKGHLKRITKSLQDPEPAIRTLIAYAMSDFGDDGRDAIPDLRERYQKDEDAGVRTAVIYALGEIGQYVRDPAIRAQVEATLTPALQDPDKNVQQTAKEALKKVRGK